MAYTTSNFDVGKLRSHLRLPLEHKATFKKQRASKNPRHLQDKVKWLLDILEQYKTISKKNKNPKETHL